MKLNVEVDCTPEEARRFMGLPDLTAVHERYVASLMETMDKGIGPEALEAVMKSWTPMGDAGIRMWQQMFENLGSKTK